MVIGRIRIEKMSRGIVLALFIWVGVSCALAQLPTATILGVVKDTSGAVVPGATLTAVNVETGQSRRVVSGGDGSYRFPALPVGNYEIKVEHPGFRTEVRSGLSLAVGQEAAVNLTMEVGAIEQTMAVTAEAPLVNTSSGSLGGLVDEERVADLPLNGRNYIDLTLLQPGIQQQAYHNPGQVGTWFSSNGAPVRSNNLLMDGAPMVNLIGASSSSISATTLGVEGIREYRVVSNSFSAEYGMTMGSQMVIVSKSGTNAFHGSLFEFLRNSALDARNFFDYTTTVTPGRLPPFKRNNFGGSFGGPIKKDKTFVFGVFEALRERVGLTTVDNVIPASAKVDGGLVPQISPVTKPWLALFPNPNLPNNQYTFPFTQPNTEDYGQIRVDQTISANDTAFARYTVDDDAQTLILSYPVFPVPDTSRNQYATLSENHVFSPALLNTFRFSFSRVNFVRESLSGITGPQYSFLPGQEIGSLNIGGVTAWGPKPTTRSKSLQNIFTWSDDMFYTRGRHALKFGALINHLQQYVESASNVRGTINFGSITSFLQGQPSSYNGLTPGSIPQRTFHYGTFGFYVQDDLRVRSNLILNLGLRYEFHTIPNEAYGHNAALRNAATDATTTLGPLFKNPSLHNIGPRFGFAWDVMGNGRTAVRGGFAELFDVGNLGASLFQTGGGNPPFSSSSTVSNPPSLTLPLFFPASGAGKSLKGIDYSLQQPHMLQFNLTVERQLPWDMAATLAYGGSRGINLMLITEGNPIVPQILPGGQKFWSGTEPRTNPNWAAYELHTAAANSWYNSLQFGLLKRVSKGLEFQSAYTWSKAIDENQGQLNGESLAANAWPADPSNIKLEKGLAAFDVAQSWHLNTIYHLPELVHKGGVMGNLLNGWGMSGILTLQTGAPFTAAIQTNRSRSGVDGGAASFGVASDRPDLVLGRNNSNITQGVTAGCPGVLVGQQLGTPNLWYDPCAFTLQPAGFLGTAGRNILRGPGLATLNFSLTKDTPLRFLGESGKLEFRAEFFNILNHANFAIPELGGGSSDNSAGVVFGGTGAAVPLPSAGIITSTNGSSRQIQFALKILF